MVIIVSVRSREYWLSCVGPGWRPIVNESLDIIETLGAQITQVKEKFGGLRIYYFVEQGTQEAHEVAAQLEEILKHVQEAERRCAIACEECGEPAVTVDVRGWLHTYCKKHLTEKENLEKILE